MKILICGDKHLKITRFDLCKTFLDWLNELIKKEQPDMYIALGDDMDTHAVLRSEIMSEFRSHIDFVCAQEHIDMYYVLGNHDYFKPKNTTYHALQSFKGIHKRFNLIEELTEVDNFTFVPYLNDHTTFPKKTREICIAHQTFIGADYGYMRPEAGVDADTVSANIIISGHIHKRQEFGKVIYPGTPYAFNVNDIDQDKGVMIFDTETYEKKFISAPFPRWRSLKFDLGSDCTVDHIHKTISKTANKKDNWVIQITGPKVEMTAYIDSKRYKELIKNVNLTTRLVPTDKNKKKVAIKALTINDIVKEYVVKVYKGNIDKNQLFNKSIEIVEKVNSTA